MSFLNNIGGLLQQFANAKPDEVENAASDHVSGMDSSELVDHLSASAQNMDAGTLGSLATSLLGALTAHGHDESQVQDAGIATGDARNGDLGAVTGLIEHAEHNPGALKDAAVDFIKNNPQAVEQLTPDFLKGLLAKFE